MSTEMLGGGAVVSIAGDFERSTSLEVDEEARRQLEQRGPRLVLDLSHTTFIDATAIRLVETLSSQASAEGGSLVVVLTCPRARRLLDVIPVSEELLVVGSVEDAMAAWAGDGQPRAGLASP